MTSTDLHRTMVLVDPENELGGGRLTADAVALLRATLVARGLVHDQDHVVLACAPGNALAVADGWPGARYLWRRGLDGADLALLEVVSEEGVSERFEHVVICSGDGIFALAVRFLAATGCRVEVVGRQRHCSHLLWRHAARVVLLPDLVDASGEPVAAPAAGVLPVAA